MKPGTPPPWSYTRNQRLGLLLLLVIISAAYGLRTLITSKHSVTIYTNEELLVARERLPEEAGLQEDESSAITASFTFDPNTVPEGDLVKLGLSEKQASAFVKYRKRRPFRNAGEIRKLYVLHPEQTEKLVTLARINQAPEIADPVTEPDEQIAEIFPFDPNTISADSFKLLGFSDREAKILVKYRSYREITFHKPEDLLRVTALDSLRVKELLSVINIAGLPEPPAPVSPPTNERTLAASSFDINTTSLKDWQTIPGIGPFRAAQIMEFRDELGGFSSIDQLGDVYGLPDSTFQKIRPLLFVSSIAPSLFVNRMDTKNLARHPYLDRRTAAIIVRYRDNHGPFLAVDDLRKVRALTTESLDALLPYLNFEL